MSGERGPKGDHGQQGDPGEVGAKGETGPISVTLGERGPKGDRGDAGGRGQVGPASTIPGERGPRGDHGSPGHDGERGTRGAASFATRRAMLTLFAMLVGMFLLLAWRSEINADRIEANTERISKSTLHDRKVQQRICDVTEENAVRLNIALDAIIEDIRQNRNMTKQQRDLLVARYQGAKAKLPICGYRVVP